MKQRKVGALNHQNIAHVFAVDEVLAAGGSRQDAAPTVRDRTGRRRILRRTTGRRKLRTFFIFDMRVATR